MIRAIVFDLDGTLLQTEKLKALSYAAAVQQVRGLPAPAPEAVEAYREIVGVTREEASRHIVEKLGLEDSVNGVRAAIAAGVGVVAIATPFTSAGLHSSGVIEDAWIVHEPEQVMEVVRRRMEELDQSARRSR